MNKRMRAFLVTVVFVLLALPAAGQAPRKAVMVVDFADRVGGWSYTRETVTSRMINRLRDDAAIRVLSRDQVQDALRQARVETAGLLDSEDALKVAKALSADYVLMGEVTAFDQQHKGGCVPIVGCVYTITATVNLRGKVLDVAGGTFVGEPSAESSKQATSASIWVGPWWSSISVSNFDSQLIGKATIEAVDTFVQKARPAIK
jgi:curli biogenesis system outer membrane secretion channel CsgG